MRHPRPTLRTLVHEAEAGRLKGYGYDRIAWAGLTLALEKLADEALEEGLIYQDHERAELDPRGPLFTYRPTDEGRRLLRWRVEPVVDAVAGVFGFVVGIGCVAVGTLI